MATPHVTLRPVRDDDLPLFFVQQSDPEANYMAAFTRPDPTDRAAFDAHWIKIRADHNNIHRTIEADGQVVGNIFSYLWGEDREVGYGLLKAYWGQGIATAALRLFLQEITERPLHAAAATDNLASLRVLQKCGFRVTGHGRAFANARGQEIDEVYLTLE